MNKDQFIAEHKDKMPLEKLELLFDQFESLLDETTRRVDYTWLCRNTELGQCQKECQTMRENIAWLREEIANALKEA